MERLHLGKGQQQQGTGDSKGTSCVTYHQFVVSFLMSGRLCFQELCLAGIQADAEAGTCALSLHPLPSSTSSSMMVTLC